MLVHLYTIFKVFNECGKVSKYCLEWYIFFKNILKNLFRKAVKCKIYITKWKVENSTFVISLFNVVKRRKRSPSGSSILLLDLFTAAHLSDIVQKVIDIHIRYFQVRFLTIYSWKQESSCGRLDTFFNALLYPYVMLKKRNTNPISRILIYIHLIFYIKCVDLFFTVHNHLKYRSLYRLYVLNNKWFIN